MSYLAIAGMLVLVLLPVIVPAIITAAHAVLGTNRPVQTLSHLRPAVA
jgi:ABC-type transport system involved in cytochrome c biogenesis permease component